MITKQVIAAALLVLALTGQNSQASAQQCLSPGEGQALVQQGQVQPFPSAVRQAGISADRVVDVQLCQSGGGYVYRVRVLDASGQVTAMNIPAG